MTTLFVRTTRYLDFKNKYMKNLSIAKNIQNREGAKIQGRYKLHGWWLFLWGICQSWTNSSEAETIWWHFMIDLRAGKKLDRLISDKISCTTAFSNGKLPSELRSQDAAFSSVISIFSVLIDYLTRSSKIKRFLKKSATAKILEL